MSTTTNEADRQSLPPRRRWGRRLLKGLLYSLVGLLLLVGAVLIFFRGQAALRETKTGFEVAPQTGRFVRAGDVEIFIQEVGPASGSVVLFIHGTGAWSEIWREPMEVLAAAGFRTIALDLPPFGFSERPSNATYGRQAQAKRIIGVLDALNIPQATLVGHSFGAGPTVEATLLAPDRVERLVLVDAALGLTLPGEPPRRQSPVVRGLLGVRPLRTALVAATATNPRLTKMLLEGLILDPADATDTQITMLQQQLVIQDSSEALGDWMLAFLTPQAALSNNLAAYATLAMPTLIIWGDSDTIVPLTHGEYLADVIPKAKLVVLKQVGHIPHIEEVDLFIEVMLSFLAKP